MAYEVTFVTENKTISVESKKVVPVKHSGKPGFEVWFEDTAVFLALSVIQSIRLIYFDDSATAPDVDAV
ncbi:hypothetical protein KC887_04880 [Candidatus Kaiserbacteria bacterium]|nr:hypothetical protein [Candidatus Kaiserbacteria bacterium]